MVCRQNIDGLMQERRNSIANALGLRLSCTNLSMWRNTCYLFQPLHLPHDTWPSQTVFDPRPCQEHIAYVILSPHSSYDYSKRLRQGPLYLYDVRDGQLLQICSSVCFVQCLLNGRQLLVADREVDTYHNRRWLIKVLDSATFDVIFKVNIHTQVYNLSTQTMAFYSSDYKKTRFCGMARQRADPGTGNTCVCHDFIHGRDMFIFDDSQGNLSCHHLKIPDGPPYGIWKFARNLDGLYQWFITWTRLPWKVSPWHGLIMNPR